MLKFDEKLFHWILEDIIEKTIIKSMNVSIIILKLERGGNSENSDRWR